MYKKNDVQMRPMGENNYCTNKFCVKNVCTLCNMHLFSSDYQHKMTRLNANKIMLTPPCIHTMSYTKLLQTRVYSVTFILHMHTRRGPVFVQIHTLYTDAYDKHKYAET